jgi:hypothetical protein
MPGLVQASLGPQDATTITTLVVRIVPALELA